MTPPAAPETCMVCKASDHLPVNCPKAYCEKCGNLGHLASICYEFLPWTCVAPMFAFQGRGQGFYYINDACTAKQMKERGNSIVITVVEGEATSCQIEQAFYEYLGRTWRCTARPIGTDMYVMRFPNSREVAKACYSERMVLKSCGARVELAPWSDAVGTKGVLEKAWVNIGNIPLEKRNERNVASVASLVRVPLELDKATLFRPESVRVKIGCRSVDEILPVAESVLGDYFYDFFFAIDEVLVRNAREQRPMRVDNNPVEHISKRLKRQVTVDEKIKSVLPADVKSAPAPQGENQKANDGSQEFEDSEESLDNTLLIDSMAQELDLSQNKNGADEENLTKVATSKQGVEVKGSANKNDGSGGKSSIYPSGGMRKARWTRWRPGPLWWLKSVIWKVC